MARVDISRIVELENDLANLEDELAEVKSYLAQHIVLVQEFMKNFQDFVEQHHAPLVDHFNQHAHEVPEQNRVRLDNIITSSPVRVVPKVTPFGGTRNRKT